jgi:hypothetical protein
MLGMHSCRRRVWAALALAALTGCGNLTPGGIQRGDATVVVSGDEPEPSPQPAAYSAGATPARTSPIIGPPGEVEATFSAYLVSEVGTALRLGGSSLDILVAIDGSTDDRAVTESVPVGHYNELRLVFTDVTATVLGGLPILGELRVDIGSELTVSRPIDADVVEDGEVTLLVDLNAPAWLILANPITRLIEEAAFAALVEVGVQ